ncbi:MAG: hypothetical protein P8X62_03220, partial [Flavobacteriaceae bacterium]
AGVTVILPIINENSHLSTDVWITFVQRFLFVVVLMLPFEIRDLQYDDLKLATIPQKIGVKQTKFLGIILLMVFFFFEYFKDEISPYNLLSILIISLSAMIIITFSKKNQGKYYTAFWVEALPIVWLFMMLFFD